jgi:hypothetical protein
MNRKMAEMSDSDNKAKVGRRPTMKVVSFGNDTSCAEAWSFFNKVWSGHVHRRLGGVCGGPLTSRVPPV